MKSVVIASGKGGTGKTTLTALLAYRAARSVNLVLADCDVEASNLPIALGAEWRTCHVFEGSSIARVTDPVRCAACGRCEEVCRFDALHPDVEHDTYVVDPFACEGCGYCARVCPINIIEMNASTVGRICTGTTAIGSIAFGQLGPGEDLSGKLVTEVRGRALQTAEENGADLLLIDGPPGIGCPVIAAVTNTDLVVAVTEPTVSGEHDLARLVELARRFDLPVGVVLNKADLSASGATRIRAFCATQGLPLIAEIEFDRGISTALESLAAGHEPDGRLAALPAIDAIWDWIDVPASVRS
jgi:MinD superfamily P-loop ATPase